MLMPRLSHEQFLQINFVLLKTVLFLSLYAFSRYEGKEAAPKAHILLLLYKFLQKQTGYIRQISGYLELDKNCYRHTLEYNGNSYFLAGNGFMIYLYINMDKIAYFKNIQLMAH